MKENGPAVLVVDQILREKRGCRLRKQKLQSFPFCLPLPMAFLCGFNLTSHNAHPGKSNELIASIPMEINLLRVTGPD